MATSNPKDRDQNVTPTSAELAQEAHDDNRGPTIVMQGVSGKKITADVKVVKVRKKAAAPAQQTPAPEAAAPAPAAAPAAPPAEKKPAAPAAAAAPAPVVEKAEKKPAEAPVKPAPVAPAPEKKAEPAPVEKPAAPKAEEKPAAQPAKPAAPVAPAAKEEAPVKPVEPAPAPAAEKVEKKEEKPAAQPAKPAPQPEKPVQAPRQAAPVQRPAHQTKPAAQPAAKAPAKAADQPNAGKIDPAKSSLAATAAYFAAQAAARKKAAEQRVQQSAQRRESPANRGPRPGSDEHRGGGRGRRDGGGGYFGKDKDEEVKLQSHPRNPQPKRTNTFGADLVSNTKENSRSLFASRDSQSKRNDRGDRDSERNSWKNQKSRRKDFGMGEDDEFRGRKNRGAKKKDNRGTQHVIAQLTHVSLPEIITVKEFAEAIKKTSAEVIKELMKLGVMATLNQEIDYDTASLLADAFGIKTDKIVEVTEEDILFDDSEDAEENLQPRPPVVCVMGHVDHGKTSLLDYIRNSSVARGEAGGITQHIGAYMVELNGRKITFLDTPGHEAFTTMRARGAQATDIAILVVAADDGVKPQTIEAINHAKAAGTQVVVAINKMDRPGANPERVREELSKYELIPEEWGGSTVMVPVSAKTGEGIEELLEMVLLSADILDLKANPNRQAKGIVIEAKLDKQRGPVATLLVKRGTLHTGDTVVMGEIVGRVRAMSDATGKMRKTAGPSVPVEIIGLPDVPEAGETFYQVEDEKVARQLAEKRRVKNREAHISGSSRMSLDTLFEQMAAGEVKDLNLIVKADVQGSVEAVNQSMTKLSNNEVKVKVIHSAVGAITESDVRLAEVSNAIIIGFNVRPAANVADQAKEAGVDLRLYRVIYHAIEDVEAAMKGMLAPKLEEVDLGRVEIRQVFKASNIGTIGGGYVTNGKIVRNCKIRLVRDGVIVWDGKLASLKRFKDDVKEVAQGYECGLSIENFNDIKEGDVIEAYEMQEVERD